MQSIKQEGQRQTEKGWVINFKKNIEYNKDSPLTT